MPQNYLLLRFSLKIYVKIRHKNFNWNRRESYAMRSKMVLKIEQFCNTLVVLFPHKEYKNSPAIVSKKVTECFIFRTYFLFKGLIGQQRQSIALKCISYSSVIKHVRGLCFNLSTSYELIVFLIYNIFVLGPTSKP